MKTGSDIYRKSKNNRKTREIRIPEQKERDPASCEAYELNETPEQEYKTSSAST